MRTYKAVQVTEPGKLQLVELPIREPEPGRVRVRVEACGVCHSDSGTVEGLFPISWPRVPGHEVVGRIDALGSGVQGWAVGQRVGVGFLGVLRLLRVLSKWRSSELPQPGIHGHSFGWGICRDDDRKGERAYVDP